MESDFPAKTFSGVRFALVGFNPIDANTLRSKLLSGGGVDVGQYNQTCTHLIVDKLVYDDPTCVTARNNGKVVVTRSWVDHSFDAGLPIDANSVLYRPLRDLNGIPGSKTLIVCLTGYLRQDRDDIMTMVDLMGGQFSKPLVANRVTHLICYKFEGEKYELAKRMKRIKIVNHRWLEDCLKNWKLLPETDYEISGHELEVMEASAQDSEDEAEDASVKRANHSPLGLRVSAVAAVGMSKSGGKDTPVIQTNSVPHEGPSFTNTPKDKWLTPKGTERPLEPMVSTDGAAVQNHNYQRASTFQDTSNHASPIPVNKTIEQGMGRMETIGSASINTSSRRHSSLATYSRKTPQSLSETKESGGHNGSVRMDDRDLKRSPAFNISASKSGSPVERTSLLDDFNKTDKLQGEDASSLLPQAKFTDGSVSSGGSQKVHHSSEANIPPLASLFSQGLRPSSSKENLRAAPTINDPTENGEVGHKSPASVEPMEDAMPTAKKITSKFPWDEIPDRPLTVPKVGSILLQESRSGSPELNHRAVPNISDHTEGREVKDKVDVSDSSTRLCASSVVPREADVWTPGNRSSAAEPEMNRASNTPGSGSIEMKDKPDTDLPKKKTVPRKSLGTRGRKKNPINQKGSIYLSEPTPKDERTDCLHKGNVSEPATDKENQKEISSPVVNTMAVPEMAKHIVSETKALNEIESADNKSHAPEEKDHLVLDLVVNQDKVQAKTSEKANAEVEITMRELELKDAPSKSSIVGGLQLEVKKTKSKRTREASAGKNNLQNGKKESSFSTAGVAKSSVKKTKKSGKEPVAKANDTSMKDLWDYSAEENEDLELENISEIVCSGEDQRPVAGETLARKGAETNDQSDAGVQLGVDNKKGEYGKATVEKSRLQIGKKRSLSTAEVDKPIPKKAKRSKKEDGAKANDTEIKDAKINSAEVKENVDKKSERGSSDEAQSLAVGKTLARKEAAAKKTLARKEAASKHPSNDGMQLEADKKKRKNRKEGTVERSSLESGKGGGSSTVEVGKSSGKKPKKTKKECIPKATDTVLKDIGDDKSLEEKENVAVDNKAGREESPVSGKPIARKKAAKSAKAGTKVDKESKQLNAKPLVSRKVLHDREQEPKVFIVSGPRAQRNEYQRIIKSLNGKCCKDSHQWSYQATHFIAPEVKRTEKFFAAAASGSWIMKTDYVADSKEAGKLLPEEPYEWHGTGLSGDGSINLESPRKWRLVREQTGHGALFGMRIVIYGDCTIPSLDTLKRAVKAGDGKILATAPPYTRFLNKDTDYALISPGMPCDDVWVQEFIRHEIPCVLSDYIVEYVCKTGYALDKYVLYNTNSWADRSFNKMQSLVHQ
ncbi:unnamed protein product [Cochlearia groenlandica]